VSDQDSVLSDGAGEDVRRGRLGNNAISLTVRPTCGAAPGCEASRMLRCVAAQVEMVRSMVIGPPYCEIDVKMGEPSSRYSL
jgi:hypothetical protein